MRAVRSEVCRLDATQLWRWSKWRSSGPAIPIWFCLLFLVGCTGTGLAKDDILFVGLGDAAGARVFVDGRYIGAFPDSASTIWGPKRQPVRRFEARLALGSRSVVVVTAVGDTVRGKFEARDSGVMTYDASQHAIL